MGRHYDAFISYRHHPVDMAVAKEIQHRLENYHVPLKIQRGHGKIHKLFRDQDELPISSKLPDNIAHALEHSEFLIVLCSTRTHESEWVLREIREFISTHNRKQILTVLVDGEPDEVIPEILRYQEETDPVTGEVVLRKQEPLSCDWRIYGRNLSRREFFKAKYHAITVELPRLAAAILDCAYDDLVQRKKRRRTRICTAFLIAAALLGFAFGFQKSHANKLLKLANTEIQSNLSQALSTQSVFLASASRELLEQGDRLGAISLALEALPEYPGERPYMAEAESALTQAARVYAPYTSMTAVSAMELDADLLDFQISPYGTLFALDTGGQISLWDTRENTALSRFTPDLFSNDMLVTQEEGLLVHSILNGRLQYFENFHRQEPALVWETKGIDDYALTDQDSVLITSEYNSSIIYHTGQADQKDEIIIHFLNPKTGENSREPLVLDVTGENCYPSVRLISHRLPSAHSIILKRGFREAALDSYFLLNPETGEMHSLFSAEDACDQVLRTPGGSLVTLSWSPVSAENPLSSPRTVRVSCFSEDSAVLKWEYTFDSYTKDSHSTLALIRDGKEIFVQKDHKILTLNTQTGEPITQTHCDSIPVKVSFRENSADLVLQNGDLLHYNYDGNIPSHLGKTVENLKLAAFQDGKWFCAAENQDLITVHKNYINPQIQPLSDNYIYNMYPPVFFEDKCLISDCHRVLLYDIPQGKLMWSNEDLPMDSAQEPIGLSPDHKTMVSWIQKDRGHTFFWDLPSGVWRNQKIPQAISQEPFCTTNVKPIISGEFLYQVVYHENSQQFSLVSYHFPSETYRITGLDLEQYDTTYIPEEKICSLQAGKDGKMILELRGGKRLLEADPETGEVRLLFTSPSPNRDLFYGYRDHYMYIADDKLIQLTDLDTGKALNIETVGFQALSLTIAGDRLLALTNQGKLMVYSLEGQLLCQRNLNLQSDDLMNYGVHYWTLPDISWFFPEENTLILQIGGNCSMINCRRWTPIISLKDKYFYDWENDLFVISAHTLLTVQRYRLEELMAHAQAILGDYRLSPRQRSAYGIQETDQNIFVTDPQA